MGHPIWISETDLDHLTIRRAVELLREGMAREGRGVARNMAKTHVAFPGGTLHAIGAVFEDANLLGVKTWAHTPKGATPLEILWDAQTGALLAIIEAFAMGQFRTAGMAGLATDYMADQGAELLALCGAGKQAMAQLAAAAAVRPLKAVRVWSRDAERREAFAARARDGFGLIVEPCATVEETVRDAPIITLVTRATSPFLTPDMAARGAHINAMGAITPERQEFSPQLLERCDLVATDSLAQAKALASEMRAAWGEDFDRPNLKPLSALISADQRRPAGADLTLFKSLGVGIADLAIAEDIYRAACERGVGLALPTPKPSPAAISTLTSARA